MPLDVRQLDPLELTVVPVEIASDSAPAMDVRVWAAGADCRRRGAAPASRGVADSGDHSPSSRRDRHYGRPWRQRRVGGSSWPRSRFCEPGRVRGATTTAPWRRIRRAAGADSALSASQPLSGTADAETLTHELGHNMALQHAPCGGTGDADEDYPYENGVTGAWGYNPTTRRLVHPLLHRGRDGVLRSKVGQRLPLHASDRLSRAP